MIKKLSVLLGALLVVAGLASAATPVFNMNGFYLTPQLGLASWGGSVPFGVNGEYAVTKNIGIGGTAMFQFWSDSGVSESWIMLSAEGYYHFDINVENLDLYVGAGLGYGIYSVSGTLLSGSGSSGLILEPLAGVRYYFSPKIAVSLRLTGSVVGGYTGFGGAIGVTFVLK